MSRKRETILSDRGAILLDLRMMLQRPGAKLRSINATLRARQRMFVQPRVHIVSAIRSLHEQK
jgi:hypothetical protein